MTMPHYKNGKPIMTAACYKSGNDNDKSDNNEDKICSLLKRWGLIGHLLNHMLDHVLDHMLDHMLNYMLDHIIIGLVTTALHQMFLPINKKLSKPIRTKLFLLTRKP